MALRDDDGDIFDHPDLRNPTWLARVEKDAKKAARKARPPRVRKRKSRPREPRPRRFSTTTRIGLIITSALVVVSAATYLPKLWTKHDHTTATTADLAFRVDMTHPFENTPASGWSDGAAGIVTPIATPLRGHSAKEVQDAFDRTKAVVIASRLDPDVIERGDLTKATTLLSAYSKRFLDEDPHSRSSWVTKIANEYPLLPVRPKVSGRMWADIDNTGNILIHTDYVVAYAFAIDDPSRIRGPFDIVAVERHAADYVHYTDPKWDADTLGIRLSHADGYRYSMSCTAADRGELAPAYSDHSHDPAGDLAGPERYLDPNSSLQVPDDCH
ncbi:hypothetical protein [Actinokineospora inagensis]|uniref:hypothetical protein n=1 Tax=Actinokineospora inagensis TaxID=103730 RepID=UPI0004025BFA|nr:hypothetical protein [Actinokineospora inagensis]